jgi:hypothetical protein
MGGRVSKLFNDIYPQKNKSVKKTACRVLSQLVQYCGLANFDDEEQIFVAPSLENRQAIPIPEVEEEREKKKKKKDNKKVKKK